MFRKSGSHFGRQTMLTLMILREFFSARWRHLAGTCSTTVHKCRLSDAMSASSFRSESAMPARGFVDDHTGSNFWLFWSVTIQSLLRESSCCFAEPSIKVSFRVPDSQWTSACKDSS